MGITANFAAMLADLKPSKLKIFAGSLSNNKMGTASLCASPRPHKLWFGNEVKGSQGCRSHFDRYGHGRIGFYKKKKNCILRTATHEG